MSYQWINYLVVSVFIVLFVGCTGLPKGITPVNSFDGQRYLGHWYEIARIENRFERGLRCVTADYIKRSDGGIDVVNRGFTAEKQTWVDAKGKAYFVKSNDIGYLKVSFFGPFYSSYIVFELDEKDYQYAFVSGYNKEYLWLLSRTPNISPDIVKHFKAVATAKGYSLKNLVITDQQCKPTSL